MCVLTVAASCSKVADVYDGPQEPSKEEISRNVTDVFGVQFDDNQDWAMMKSGTVTIVADVADFATVRVEVLTANPFVHKDAKVLNSAAATTGQKVTLAYDAPDNADTIYAACVNDKNYYRVQPFVVGQAQVSFKSSSRSIGRTRAVVNMPQITSEARLSDNAQHVQNGVEQWVGSGWDDRFFDIDATIEEVEDFTETERKELYNTITGIMPENTSNIDKVLESQYLINTSNYFYADGTSEPIKITPVRCGADFLGWESLYYYYYDPADLEGKSDDERADYIKHLPKFKLLECADALVGLDKGNTIEERVAYARSHTSSWRNTTRRSRTYTLAYFDQAEQGAQGSYTFPAGYRIGLMFRVEERPANSSVMTKGANFYADSLLNNEINKFGPLWYGWNSAVRKQQNNYLGYNRSRAAVFSANGKAYIGFEDYVDADFNDVVFEVSGGVTLFEDSIQLDKNVYTYAFEDTRLGDYDMNDVVIKAQRVDRTHVQLNVVASGAKDELYIRGIDSQKLTGSEVHALFGQKNDTFINTVRNEQVFEPVSDVITVPADFSFTEQGRDLYIYNKTKGYEVRLSEKGEDPHGILIPYDWRYPVEYMCVKNAYLQFNNWGAKKVDETDWYKFPEENKVY